MKSKPTSGSGSGRPPVSAETVNIRRIPVSAAAEIKEVSRQSIWLATQKGRLNGVCNNGVWMIYVDDKFTEWSPNRPRRLGNKSGLMWAVW